MDTLALMLLFVLGGLVWWWWQKRQPPPVEDEWVLPPQDGPSILARPKPPGATDPSAPEHSTSPAPRHEQSALGAPVGPESPQRGVESAHLVGAAEGPSTPDAPPSAAHVVADAAGPSTPDAPVGAAHTELVAERTDVVVDLADLPSPDSWLGSPENPAASSPGFGPAAAAEFRPATPATPTAPTPATPAPRITGEVFDRESLLRRDRTFDPRNWDNSPDGSGLPGLGGGADDGDLPRFFDRDYLERRARERGKRAE